jgi:tRNA G18 (ribose-2'-O)-methylase SpoU
MNLNANSFFEGMHYPATPENIAPVIITSHLKTPENIGHIIRIAGNTGCRKVIVINDGELHRLSKIKHVADVAGKLIEWQIARPENFLQFLPEGYTIVALETMPGSQNLFTTALPQKMALMVGNEKSGISPTLFDHATLQMHIPVPGPVKSLNVAQAATICLYEWLRQHVLLEL